MSNLKIKDADSTDKYLASIGLGTDVDPNYSVPADIYNEIALGNVPNRTNGAKFGRVTNVDTGTTPQDIWGGGGDYTGHPDSFTPETVDVSSSSANDTSAGTGARTVRITGLKTSTSTAYESEDITMNGTSDVTSVSTWWRVNRIEVLTAGSGGENAGVITCNSTTTTTNVFAEVEVGFNQSTVGAYTVPYGQTMVLKRLRASIVRSNGSAGSATITLRARPQGGVYNSKKVFELGTDSPTQYTNVTGEVFVAGTDIKGRVDAVSDNDTIAEMAFEYILIAD